MSVYDIKVESLDELPGFGSSVVVGDCDGTLFYPDTAELYPDVEEKLRSVACIALVSAHPDSDLLQGRMQAMGADIGINPDNNRPVWCKKALFTQAARRVLQITEQKSAIIIGDRPLMDVGVGQVAFREQGFSTVGVCMARPEQPYPSKFDYVLRPAYRMGSLVAKATGQAERFRPTYSSGYNRYLTLVDL